MNEIELSIVMPCLNEAETLATCVRKAQGFLKSHGVSGEVIVADNGSTDGSQKIAQGLGAIVVPVASRGYGSAILGGIAGSRGKFIVMGDADDSYDFTNLMPFLEKLREGFGLVMGNRFQGEIKPGAMPPLHKYLGNPVLTAIGRLLFGSPAGDFHCGLRAFSREAALKMDLRTTGMEFASEMVVKATLFKLRIAEVPTTLSKDGRSRPPHLRSWRDGWRHLRFLLMYSPRWLFLYPGILLMVVGGALGAWILPRPRFVGTTMIDVHSLLYAAGIFMVGVQSFNFALFSKIYAVEAGLMPRDSGYNKIFDHINLELGLVIGALFLLMGLGLSVCSVMQWADNSFGPLNYQITLRQMIPAVFLLMLGCQIIFSSFFLSMMGTRRK